MFATAFGTDGTAGDTSFHPQHFEASADDTFDTLMEKWRKIAAREYFGEGSEPLTDEQIEEEGIETPEGFWVYSESTKGAVEAACDYDPGCDSGLYAMIHSAKLIMSRQGRCVSPGTDPVKATLHDVATQIRDALQVDDQCEGFYSVLADYCSGERLGAKIGPDVVNEFLDMVDRMCDDTE